jgi:hypothetical protein
MPFPPQFWNKVCIKSAVACHLVSSETEKGKTTNKKLSKLLESSRRPNHQQQELNHE